MATRIDELQITGSIVVKDTGVSTQTRATILKQDANVAFPVALTLLRVWDAYHTNLPGTAAGDDLALIGGVFGTAPPTVSAGDLKAAGITTRYARFEDTLPECYDSGQTVSYDLSAGMVTTIADTSCTLDVQCYKIDKITGIGGDLVTTVPTTINSLTFGSKSFVVNPAGLVAGDVLDIRIAVACTDAATGTAVAATIASIDLVCDIKG